MSSEQPDLRVRAWARYAASCAGLANPGPRVLVTLRQVFTEFCHALFSLSSPALSRAVLSSPDAPRMCPILTPGPLVARPLVTRPLVAVYSDTPRPVSLLLSSRAEYLVPCASEYLLTRQRTRPVPCVARCVPSLSF
jgi:hypothetical protein